MASRQGLKLLKDQAKDMARWRRQWNGFPSGIETEVDGSCWSEDIQVASGMASRQGLKQENAKAVQLPQEVASGMASRQGLKHRWISG